MLTCTGRFRTELRATAGAAATPTGWYYCTIVLLYYCTVVLLYYCTIVLLYYCTIVLLYVAVGHCTPSTSLNLHSACCPLCIC
jgi:hypothetical protein